MTLIELVVNDALGRCARGDLDGYPPGWREACHPAPESVQYMPPPTKFDSARRAEELMH